MHSSRKLENFVENRRERLKTGRAVLDGTHLPSAWLDAGRAVGKILLTQDGLDNAEVAGLLSRVPVPVVILDRHLFAELSELPSQTGVLSVVDIPFGTRH